jgi:signal transduction histidine kinase
LLALVNDVLDISKIEAGQLEINRAPFDLRTSIDKVLALVTPQAQAKHLDLRSNIAADLGSTVGDARRFEQVLLNILGNAIKFTEQGSVAVRAELRNASSLLVQVSDTGIGIKPEEMKHLFQPFRQIEGGLTRQHEGTGLGLAICRRLAELMGAEITVSSEWSKGSTFSVLLPLHRTEAV